MKKLFAILLSVLLLCGMTSFATVSASDEPTIVVSTVEVADAGDEIEVTVQLLNNPGIISAKVEILYDESALELLSYYDEDEEMDMNMIEPAKGWSSKYITYGPVGDCLMNFCNGTASKNVDKEDFFTATFKVKDDAISGTYPLTIKYDPADFFDLNLARVEFGKQDATITINGTEPPAGCEHEYEYDCSKNCSKCGEETRPEAEHEYFYACDANCTICGQTTNESAAHNLVYVEAKAPTCTEEGHLEYWYCDICGACWSDEDLNGFDNDMSIKPNCSYNAIHNEGIAAGCHYTGRVENWYCDICDVYYLDAACTQITNYKSLTIPALQDSADYVAAKTPTCTENGNVEYWYCADCEQVWADAALTQLTNIKNVQIAPSCSYNAIHNEGVAAGCHYTGRVENWYCANCDVYYLDAACTQITNYKSLTIPALQASAEHVAAKAPTCIENGNVEYWYCAECEQVWADAALTQLTNIKNVQIGTVDHTYTNAHDASCDVCGAEREITLPATEIVLFGGNSVTEERGGLAFKFDVAANGIVWDEEYNADYTNATITIDGVEYKLVTMGAIANNQGLSNQTLEDVDGFYTLDINAKKVFSEGENGVNYAIRIVNIPAEQLDTVITVRSYYVYENAGELITVYGENLTSSYNQAQNG